MKVNLILLYNKNVISKEIIMPKYKAIIRGFFWKNNFLHIRRNYLITDINK